MNYDDDDDDDADFNNWIVNTPQPVPKLFTTSQEENYGPKPVKAKPITIDEDGEVVVDDGYRKPFFNPNGREVVPDHLRSHVITSMKLTTDQHTLYISLGGTTWVKEQLLKATNFDRDKCKRLKEKDRIAAVRLKRELKLKQLKDSQ